MVNRGGQAHLIETHSGATDNKVTISSPLKDPMKKVSNSSSGHVRVSTGNSKVVNQTSVAAHHNNSSTNVSKKGNTKNSIAATSSSCFDWLSFLASDTNRFAPVSSFKHAPLSENWDNLITMDLKVEVRNKDVIAPNKSSEFYWICSVKKICGYMVQLRYEGFGNDCSHDFWLNVCTPHVHPVGWCAQQGKSLIPPKTIEDRHEDWKSFLVKRLTGSRTLPENFAEEIKEANRSKFKTGMKLEVVDKNRISAVRLATVDEIIGGRIHVAYDGAEAGDEGFWCHERSPIIHPVGWAQYVGHELKATPEYAEKSLAKVRAVDFNESKGDWSYFQNPLQTAPQPTQGSDQREFKENMKLEAIDPLNLATICVATVTKVLKKNFLMIGIDGMMDHNGSDWFCYHASSPCIFPVGFCSLNKIPLKPPNNYEKNEFNWFEYLRETKSAAAPVSLFNIKEIPKHGFKEGMYVEAVDLMEPRLICVAQITKVSFKYGQCTFF